MGKGDTSKFSQFVQCFADMVQELENTYTDIKVKRQMPYATAAQLDGIGEIVIEDRQGRNDTDYKAAIIAKIYMNASCGEPERIISAIKAITQSVEIHYISIYPAKIYITFVIDDSISLPSQFYTTMQRLCPSGVLLYLVGIDSSAPFQFNGSYGFDTGKLATLYKS